MEQSKTSMGIEPNIAGLLCYLLGWITGVIFYIAEKDNQFVKFHAMQSIVVFGSITVLYIIIFIIQGILISIAYGLGAGVVLAISGLIGIFMILIGILSLGLWILLMIKAYQNETFKLPVVGEIAAKQLK